MFPWMQPFDTAPLRRQEMVAPEPNRSPVDSPAPRYEANTFTNRNKGFIGTPDGPALKDARQQDVLLDSLQSANCAIETTEKRLEMTDAWYHRNNEIHQRRLAEAHYGNPYSFMSNQERAELENAASRNSQQGEVRLDALGRPVTSTTYSSQPCTASSGSISLPPEGSTYPGGADSAMGDPRDWRSEAHQMYNASVADQAPIPTQSKLKILRHEGTISFTV